MNKFEKKYIQFQFGEKARVSTYNKLIKFLRNGIPLLQALDIMWGFASEEGKKPKTPTAVALAEWRSKIREGAGLGIAVKGWVPDKDQVVIQSGEVAGDLIVALENALYIHKGTKQIKKAIIGGLAYPALLVAVTVIFMVIVSTQVVPAFAEITPKETWAGAGRSLAVMADLTNNYLHIGAGALAVMIVSIWLSLPRWTGSIRARLDRFPPYSFYRLSLGSGFLLSMSAMVRAGISVTQGMKLINKSANPWYKERITSSLRHITNGKNFGEALYLTGFQFPDKEAVSDLRAYAQLDGFDETLQKLGSEWMEDSIEKMNSQAVVLRNIALIVLAAVFGWIAVGIFSLQQQISAGF